jgi:hypothetical protein
MAAFEEFGNTSRDYTVKYDKTGGKSDVRI